MELIIILSKTYIEPYYETIIFDKFPKVLFSLKLFRYYKLIINYLNLDISEKIIIFAYRNNSIYIKSISLYGGSHFCTYRSRRLLCFVWHPQRSLGRLDKERL
jgi:hypothetical protein